MELRFLLKEKNIMMIIHHASLATWYMINKIETEFGMVFENVFQLLPSCPFRDEKVIGNVIIILSKTK